MRKLSERQQQVVDAVKANPGKYSRYYYSELDIAQSNFSNMITRLETIGYLSSEYTYGPTGRLRKIYPVESA
jgi:hypothetical protein